MIDSFFFDDLYDSLEENDNDIGEYEDIFLSEDDYLDDDLRDT